MARSLADDLFFLAGKPSFLLESFMKKSLLKKSLLAGLVAGFMVIVLGALFAVLACGASSSGTTFAGLCVAPAVWALMAALPVALLVFVLRYVYLRFLKKSVSKTNHRLNPSTLDLLTKPQVLQDWQKETNDKRS